MKCFMSLSESVSGLRIMKKYQTLVKKFQITLEYIFPTLLCRNTAWDFQFWISYSNTNFC